MDRDENGYPVSSWNRVKENLVEGMPPAPDNPMDEATQHELDFDSNYRAPPAQTWKEYRAALPLGVQAALDADEDVDLQDLPVMPAVGMVQKDPYGATTFGPKLKDVVRADQILPPEPKVAARDNAGKLSMHYPKLFPKCAALITMVFESGEVKYGYKNFLLGGKPDQEYQDSFSRHEIKLYSGLEYDVGTKAKPGSRCHHLGLMLSNLMMWVENNLQWDELHQDGLSALKGLEDLYIAAGFEEPEDK